MTRAQAIASSVTRDDDTKLIEALRREKDAAERKLTQVTADRDTLLESMEYITAALDMPDGIELAKILARISSLIEAAAGGDR